jgi:hypothetical protein
MSNDLALTSCKTSSYMQTGNVRMPLLCARICRQPPEEDELPLAARSSEEMRALNDAAWQAFWGWDCCGPDGLLERVYKCVGPAPHRFPICNPTFDRFEGKYWTPL